MIAKDARLPPAAADLYDDLSLPPVGPRAHLPGIMVATTGTLAAAFLAGHYGAPLTLMVLLVGLGLNFLSTDSKLAPGLAFTSSAFLRIAIVLLGTRITFAEIETLGPGALAAIVGLLTVTIGTAVILSPRFGFSRAFGLVAGAAVAICGASAAMAVAAALGSKRVGQAEVTTILIAISALSAGAMAIYPMAATALGMSDLQAGFLLGASIHDVAQAIGAGNMVSHEAARYATIVKLSRVTLLAPVIALIFILMPREPATRRGLLPPWFVLGFIAVAIANSMGWIPTAAGDAAGSAAAALLAVAIAATAIRAPLGQLIDAGARPFVLLLLVTLLLLSLAATASLALFS